jgi:hypothetical protein
MLATFTTIILFDLHDSSTHRWKKIDSKKRMYGHLLLFLITVGWFAYFMLSARKII